METIMEAPFITAEELATRWSMHRDTIYKVPTTELPYMKLGPNTRRYRITDVEGLSSSKTRTNYGSYGVNQTPAGDYWMVFQREDTRQRS